MKKITLAETIVHTTKGHTGTKGQEFLGRDSANKTNVFFTPSKTIVDEFVRTIGDKWGLNADKKNINFHPQIRADLLNTNIIIDGHYVMARGGICPGGVRLFEITDHHKLQDYLK